MAMELLREGAKQLGLTLGPERLAMFERYYRELASWNQRFNLTAITAYEQVQIKHFWDSLTCLLALPAGSPQRMPGMMPDTVPLQLSEGPLWVIDIGSGAGFPGLPLKIMLPEAKVTLVESVGKKVGFLRHMIQVLDLDKIEVLATRAETAAHLPEHRERYDMAVARAVAHLAVLSEYCLPFCRVGGRMVAPKGEDARAEVAAAAGALDLLGGAAAPLKRLSLPQGRSERYLVVVDKVAPTPGVYPRRVGVPSKRPLQQSHHCG